MFPMHVNFRKILRDVPSTVDRCHDTPDSIECLHGHRSSRFMCSQPFLFTSVPGKKACPTAPALAVLRAPWSFDLRRVGMASASHELRRSNLRNLVLQHLCRVCLFFVVPGCARASSSSSAPVHSSSPFVKQSLGSGGMVPRIWNNIWRFSGCPSAGPQSKARDTRATYLRLYGGCFGCCCIMSCWAACR